MNATDLYVIGSTEGKGMIAVAKKDLLPGQMVLKEEVPLMSFSSDIRSQYDYPEPFISAFSIFVTYMEDFSPSSQEVFDSLLEPPSGHLAESYRDFARTMKYKPKNEEEVRVLNPEEVELLASIAGTVNISQFVLPGKVLIFTDINRFKHSCIPNCRATVVGGTTCVCYTILPIKEGDVLTISHNSARDLEFTSQRRYRYAAEKQITCHCPRCEAPGDDTRQFDCFDPACPGVMFACQPLSKERFPHNAYTYVDVDYVEPHLLPCTVCRNPATKEYQAEMFAQEEELKKAVQKPYWELIKRSKPGELPAVFDEVLALKFPHRHSLAVKILRSQFYVYLLKTVGDLNGVSFLPQMEATARQYMDTYNGFLRFPHDAKMAAFAELGMMAMACKFSVSVDLLQAALRMNLIIQGRHHRNPPLEAELALVLDEHYHTATCQECLFCGESPLRATITLSRCGRCRQVAYCSVGCQKAHWKVHKKTCV